MTASSLAALVASAIASVRAAKLLAADAVTSARTSALSRLDAAFTAARAVVEAASREAAADLARQAGEADDALTARLADGAGDLAGACNRACAALEDAANAADASLADRADAFLASPANGVQSGLAMTAEEVAAARASTERRDRATGVLPWQDDAEVFHLTAALDDEDVQAINEAAKASKAIMEEVEGLTAPDDEEVTNRLYEAHEALPEPEEVASAANPAAEEAPPPELTEAEQRAVCKVQDYLKADSGDTAALASGYSPAGDGRWVSLKDVFGKTGNASSAARSAIARAHRKGLLAGYEIAFVGGHVKAVQAERVAEAEANAEAEIRAQDARK